MIQLSQVKMETTQDVIAWHQSQVQHHMDSIRKMDNDQRVKNASKLRNKHLDQVLFHQNIINILTASVGQVPALKKAA